MAGSSFDIEAKGLFKQFQVYQKPPGLWGSLQSLFHRQYQTKKAVDLFDVGIPAGQIVGLLGPNGAGKTTLMKMFTGIIVPSGGELKVLGATPAERKREFRKKIALVMGQKSQLWWDIPAMDSFELLKSYYEIPARDFHHRLEELATLLGVTSLLHIHVRKLSLGERMKMELMASLLHRPQIIFLDEPTIGLDVVAQKNVRQFLKDYHEREKTTMILTSHYMADVEALCSRLILVVQGQKTFDGPLVEFEGALGAGGLGQEKIVNFSFATAQNPEGALWARFDAKWNKDLTQVDLRVPKDELRSVTREILHEFPVVDFSTEKMPIERVLNTLLTTMK